MAEDQTLAKKPDPMEPCLCGHRREQHEPGDKECRGCACPVFRPFHRLEVPDLVRMNVPKEFWSKRVSGWDGLTPSVRTVAINYVRKFDTLVPAGKGLLLVGSPGVGKTSTAVLLLKEARRRYLTGYFVRVGELRHAMADQQDFDADTTVYGRCLTVDFLVIDAFGEPDLGAPWFNLDKLIDLATERAGHGRPTVVTSDLKLTTFMKKRPEVVEKLGTYLAPFEMTGEDRREAQRIALLKTLTEQDEPKQLEAKNPESKTKKGGK